ncbi:AbiH family protein [Sunxiuqinia sp. A32]|uniref:AbiH family protein n=1 Tax=Sunxiuqinia sp. A32 TaxID=3461496 RepID=UPI0040461D1D
MNYIYLVGNGFDLAHGLETSYHHFLLDLHKKAVFTYHSHYPYDYGPFSIEKDQPLENIPEIDTLPELFNYCESQGVRFNYSNKFLEYLIGMFNSQRWVDIEYLYYKKLTAILKNRSLNGKESLVEKLNSDLCKIKILLVKYLGDIKIKERAPMRYIRNHIHKPINILEKNLFLNFNYTTLINKYIDEKRGDKVLNMHGILSDEINDIIFGYGDEMDDDYPLIENYNKNSYLDNFKSFGYFKNRSYSELLDFVKSDFRIRILGHSCGISDRVLLNFLFEHRHCKKIEICYYQKSKTVNDYFEKTQEISRHFRSSNKETMRERIMNLNDSKPLVPIE